MSWVAGDTVKAPSKIAALLTRISVEAPGVTVTLEKPRGSFSISILDVSPNAERIWLDESSSQAAGKHPTIKLSLRVAGYLDGASIQFTASIAEIGRRDDVHWYGLKRPRRVKYCQRRKSQRFRCLANLSVYFVDAGAKVRHAVVNDISLGGLLV